MTIQVTKVEVCVQQDGEPGKDYGIRMSELLEDIAKKYPNGSPPILIPTASSNGRLTTLIQWHNAERIERNNIMIQGLANSIVSKVKELNITSEEVATMITNFLKP